MVALPGIARFTPRLPCPICQGHDRLPPGQGIRCYGFLSSDGDYAHCSRDELAGPLEVETNGTYAHRLAGPCRCGHTHGLAPVAHARAGPRPHRADSRPPWRDPAWRKVATFYYQGPDREPLYRVVRWETLDGGAKRFIQERRDPASTRGWRAGLGEMLRVPYHLPALLAAPHAQPILIVEGERCADAACALGFLATTNPEGGRPGAWRPELSPWFRGRHVVILPDNDAVGSAHAREVATALRGTAARIHGLLLPGLAAKGDVRDWITAGGTREALAQLVRTAPRWDHAAALPVRMRLMAPGGASVVVTIPPWIESRGAPLW